MGNIKACVDQDKSLTVHEVSGKVTIEDIIEAMAAFYAHEPTRHLIWDFTQAEVIDLSSENLKKVLSLAIEMVDGKTEGKRAIVASRPLDKR